MGKSKDDSKHFAFAHFGFAEYKAITPNEETLLRQTRKRSIQELVDNKIPDVKGLLEPLTEFLYCYI